MLYSMVIISSAYDKALGRYVAKDGRAHISFCGLRNDAYVGDIVAIHLLYACAKFCVDRIRRWRVMVHAHKPDRLNQTLTLAE